jgi:hypothetical protein
MAEIRELKHKYPEGVYVSKSGDLMGRRYFKGSRRIA